MPRRIIQELQQDVARLLQVGAGALASDEGLQQRERMLQSLIQKIPSLAPISTQIAKTRSAEPRIAASELLQLSAMLGVVRASLAAPSEVSAELAPLPQTKELRSTSSYDDAVRHRGLLLSHHYPEAELPARPELFDSRLFSSWIESALNYDKGEEYWEFIKQHIPNIDFFLSRDFTLDGEQADAMRLRLLVYLRGKELLPLVEDAYENGSEMVQGAAFIAKVCLTPLALEEAVHDALEEPHARRKLLAVYALRYIPTSKSCHTLLSLLFFESNDYQEHAYKSRLSRVASFSLINSAYPQAKERLIEFLLKHQEEISIQSLGALFHAPLSDELSLSLLAVWRRYRKVSAKIEIATTLAKHGAPVALVELFREMPSATHSPNILLRELSPRLPDSRELFLDALFALLDKFSVSDRDLLYRELLVLNAHASVRERLLQRARTQELAHREKNILQTTFEEIRRQQRNKA